MEQIFQSFANQSIASDKAAFTYVPRGDSIRLVNPDHKMTDSQLQYSKRGYEGEKEEIKEEDIPVVRSSSEHVVVDSENPDNLLLPVASDDENAVEVASNTEDGAAREKAALTQPAENHDGKPTDSDSSSPLD